MMAGALKFSGLSSSLVNSVHPLSPSPTATFSVELSMTALPLSAPTAMSHQVLSEYLSHGWSWPAQSLDCTGLQVKGSPDSSLFFSAWHRA